MFRLPSNENNFHIFMFRLPSNENNFQIAFEAFFCFWGFGILWVFQERSASGKTGNNNRR